MKIRFFFSANVCVHCNSIHIYIYMYEQHVLGVDKGVSLNMASTCMAKKIMLNVTTHVSCMYMTEISLLYISSMQQSVRTLYMYNNLHRCRTVQLSSLKMLDIVEKNFYMYLSIFTPFSCSCNCIKDLKDGLLKRITLCCQCG